MLEGEANEPSLAFTPPFGRDPCAAMEVLVRSCARHALAAAPSPLTPICLREPEIACGFGTGVGALMTI
jgi:hypothetical protein